MKLAYLGLLTLCLAALVLAETSTAKNDVPATTRRHPRDVSSDDKDKGGSDGASDSSTSDDSSKSSSKKYKREENGGKSGDASDKPPTDDASSTSGKKFKREATTEGSSKKEDGTTTKSPSRSRKETGLHRSSSDEAKAATTSKPKMGLRPARNPSNDEDSKTEKHTSMSSLRLRTPSPHSPKSTSDKDDSSSEESDKKRSPRDAEDGAIDDGSAQGNSESLELVASAGEEQQPANFPAFENFRLRRQMGKPLVPVNEMPSTESEITTLRSETSRRQRQQPDAPPPDDLSARRAMPAAGRPGNTRPNPPPQRPPQGPETLTLPDGYEIIINPVNPGFTCDNKIYGYYADTLNECKIFHVCVPIVNDRGDSTNLKWSFVCGNQTLFNQEKLTCDHKDNVDCSRAENYYDVNTHFGETQRPLGSGLGGAPGLG